MQRVTWLESFQSNMRSLLGPVGDHDPDKFRTANVLGCTGLQRHAAHKFCVRIEPGIFCFQMWPEGWLLSGKPQKSATTVELELQKRG